MIYIYNIDGSSLVHFLPTDLFRECDSSPPLVRADFIICSYGLFICLVHIYANKHVFALK